MPDESAHGKAKDSVSAVVSFELDGQGKTGRISLTSTFVPSGAITCIVLPGATPGGIVTLSSRAGCCAMGTGAA